MVSILEPFPLFLPCTPFLFFKSSFFGGNSRPFPPHLLNRRPFVSCKSYFPCRLTVWVRGTTCFIYLFMICLRCMWHKTVSVCPVLVGPSFGGQYWWTSFFVWRVVLISKTPLPEGMIMILWRCLRDYRSSMTHQSCVRVFCSQPIQLHLFNLL